MLCCYGRRSVVEFRSALVFAELTVSRLLQLLTRRFFAAFFFALLLDLAGQLAAGAEQLADSFAPGAQNLAASRC